MSRRRRIHVAGACYLLVHRASGERSLLAEPADALDFHEVLAKAARASGVRVLAYCLLPGMLGLVVSIGSAPVGSFVRRLAGEYARRINQRRRSSGHLFAQHHRATLLGQDDWLVEAIRYIHWLPVLEGRVLAPQDHSPSSHSGYLVPHRVRGLWRQPALRRFGRHPARARAACAAFLTTQPAEHVVRELASGRAAAPGAPVPEPVLPFRRSALSLDAITRTIIDHLHIRVDELFSTSRRRQTVYARALITEHALRSGAARLADLSRYFRRDPSTLLAAVEHYRASRPELFRPGTVQRLMELAKS
jgi:REP element-mobilizing transposase RayT